MAHIEHQRASLARVGTSMPTPYCSSRGKYTAHRAGRAREMPFNLLPTRLHLYPSALSAISGRISNGRCRRHHADGSGLILGACTRRERAYLYLRGGDSQVRVKAPYRGT